MAYMDFHIWASNENFENDDTLGSFSEYLGFKSPNLNLTRPKIQKIFCQVDNFVNSNSIFVIFFNLQFYGNLK